MDKNCRNSFFELRTCPSAMFDGIECKVDDNGNGIPDDEENGADYFEVSKPKATKK